MGKSILAWHGTLAGVRARLYRKGINLGKHTSNLLLRTLPA